MSLQTTYTFDDPNNFNFESGKIDFYKGYLFNQNPPTNREFYGTFRDNFDVRDKDNNIITPIDVGNSVIQHNRISYNKTTNDDVDYQNLTFSQTNKITVGFFFIPKYSGAPDANHYIFIINTADNNNRFDLIHYTNGNFEGHIYSDTGGFGSIVFNFLPIANREYYVEYSYNGDSNIARIFVDGELKASRDFDNLNFYPNFDLSKLNRVRLGYQYNNHYLRDFVIFNKVKHTTDFTVDQTILDQTKYYEIGDARLNKTADYSFLVNFKNHASDELDADYAEGSATGTGTNNLQIVSGKLDLTGDTLKYVEYEALDNFKSLSDFVIRTAVRINYTGAPTNDKSIFSIYNSSSLKNYITMIHKSDGLLCLYFYDKDGNSITYDTKAWSPTAGTVYYFEVNFSYEKQFMTLYINGSQLINKTFTPSNFRSLDLTKICLGSDRLHVNSPDFYVYYFQIIKENVRDNSISSFIDYDKTNEMAYPVQTAYYVEPKTKILTDGLEGVSGSVIDTTDGDRRYIVVRDSDLFYWNGSTWTTSDGSWAQANDPTTMIANLSSLDLTSGYNCTFRVLLYSTEGKETDAIETIIVDYNFYGGDAVSPDTCIIYGYLYDPSGNPIENATIKARLNTAKESGNKIIIDGSKIQTTSRSTGYWELALIPNDETDSDDYYIFEIYKDNFSYRENIVVPDLSSKKFSELIEL